MMRYRTCLVVGLIGCLAILTARADETTVPLDKVPKKVMNAVKKRFPSADIKEASKEGEGEKLVYEVTLKENGLNIDVTLTPHGAIQLIEREVPYDKLPKIVSEAFRKKHADVKLEMVEEVIKVEAGKETLEYYEFHWHDAANKEQEAEVTPAGVYKSAEPPAKK
jgi:hypothetical protein